MYNPANPTGANPAGALPASTALDTREAMNKEYMREMDVQRFQAQMEQQQRDKEDSRGQFDKVIKKKSVQRYDLLPEPEPTFRASIPIWRDFEYWRHRAARYPYIQKSDEKPEFFLRGMTVHPRLSDYPMCKDVITDYYACRDGNRALRTFNICAPLKEQLSSCINLVFVRNHERMAKKRNHKVRDEVYEQRREKRLHRLAERAQEITDRETKFVD